MWIKRASPRRHGPSRVPAAACLGLIALWAGAVVARSAAEQQVPEGVIVPGAASRQQAGQVAKPRPDASQKPGAPQPDAAGKADPAQPPAAGDYLNDDESCLTCHEAQKKGYADTMHGRRDHPRSPASKQGCETCHGPGARHADDPEAPGLIRAFAKEPPRQGNEVCTSCHSRGEHALWDGSAHDARNLSCASCHSVHAFKSERGQLKTARQMDTCATCHRDKVAKLDRSGHMPLREGKMECSTCHSTHGATNVRQLRTGDSIAEACTSCHADKRGPYLWEHAPTRDGCVTCHDPHGSSNERMLVTKPPILCQRCHIATRHPSTIYDGALIGSAPAPSVRIYARSCVTCHSNIHGSNHPSGQRYIR